MRAQQQQGWRQRQGDAAALCLCVGSGCDGGPHPLGPHPLEALKRHRQRGRVRNAVLLCGSLCIYQATGVLCTLLMPQKDHTCVCTHSV